MNEHDDDIAGYIAARVLGEDSDTPPQQPLHAMSLRLPYEMAAYLIELAGATDTSRVEMARQLVQAGINSVLARLPAEVAVDIHEAARERLADMISEI
jgi:predicted transcriptional regulator